MYFIVQPGFFCTVNIFSMKTLTTYFYCGIFLKLFLSFQMIYLHSIAYVFCTFTYFFYILHFRCKYESQWECPHMYVFNTILLHWCCLDTLKNHFVNKFYKGAGEFFIHICNKSTISRSSEWPICCVNSLYLSSLYIWSFKEIGEHLQDS